MKPIVLVLAVLAVAGAALAWGLGRGDDPSPPLAPGSDVPSSVGTGSAIGTPRRDTPDRTPTGDPHEASGEVDHDGGSPDADDAGADQPVAAGTREERLARLKTLLAISKKDETEAERDERHALLASLRQDALHEDSALDLASRLESESDPKLALRIGRALAASQLPVVTEALLRLADEGATGGARRAALAGLETRPADVWWGPVTTAFSSDGDDDVRTEAAEILSRSLADPADAAWHVRARATLQEGLGSADADQRVRSLTALMTDPAPTAADLDKVRALKDDEDAAVVAEAAAAERVIEARLARPRRAGR